MQPETENAGNGCFIAVVHFVLCWLVMATESDDLVSKYLLATRHEKQVTERRAPGAPVHLRVPVIPNSSARTAVPFRLEIPGGLCWIRGLLARTETAHVRVTVRQEGHAAAKESRAPTKDGVDALPWVRLLREQETSPHHVQPSRRQDVALVDH